MFDISLDVLLPKTPSGFGVFVAVVSNAVHSFLMWERLQRLEKRFNDQFEEVPKRKEKQK